MMKNRKKPELLSPCGDYSCFISAVNAGADAVYLSGDKFGARAYATNFTEEELIDAIDYAHLFGVAVYLTVNTLVKENEIDELYDYLMPFYKAGLDGVIVQDIGCITYIQKHFPLLPVHASTQMAVTSYEGVKILSDMGLTRVVLAREVSLEEINKIYDETGLELECFVHGALCYSYSGKCLFSSLVGGRSGNRGRCAGPCRQPYNNDEYLLSTKDICCLKLIPKLCNGAIASFKIEGRMKSPEYVSAVTSIYRKHIDRYYDLLEKHGEGKAEELFYNDKSLNDDFNRLISLYTRGGNSEGYYFMHNGRNMISIKSASYNKGPSDESLVAEASFEDARKITAYAYVSISKENGAILSLSTDDESVSVTYGDVSSALKQPLTIETIKKQLLKTGNTAFEITNFDFDLEDDVFMRVSDLNELRRLAIDELKNKLLTKYKRLETADIKSETNEKGTLNLLNNHIKDCNVGEIYVEVSNDEQLNAALNNDSVDGIYVPENLFINADINKIKSDFKTVNKNLYLKFPSVVRHDFVAKNDSFLRNVLEACNGVLVDNYELLEYLNDINYSGNIIGDIHLYALNNYAKDALHGLGIDRLTIPVELNKKEILSTGYSDGELIVYGKLPMMVSAQCINNTKNGCDKKTKNIYITDRTKASFLCVNDCGTYSNTIYNSVPLSLHGELKTIQEIKPSSLRIIFTDEKASMMDSIIELFVDYKNCLNDRNENVCVKKFTKGHLLRGVL